MLYYLFIISNSLFAACECTFKRFERMFKHCERTFAHCEQRMVTKRRYFSFSTEDFFIRSRTSFLLTGKLATSL